MDKLDPRTLDSPDLARRLRRLLHEEVPEVFTEGRLDLATLRALLGEPVQDPTERYGLTWSGKAEARRIALSPSSATLRPSRDASVDWDGTRNVVIEGDNLEVLKLLLKSLHRRVQAITIDPPYNTGKEFIYPDRYQDDLDTYLRITGQVDGAGARLSPNVETSGRFHTRWLNMMYPRLKLARSLLAEDGVLLVHVDEHEEHALGLLLDEVMGEENRVGTCVWDKRNPKGDATGVAYQHESILVYARDLDTLTATRPLRRPKANAARMLAAARRFVATSADLAEAGQAYRAWVKAQPDLSGGEAMYNRLDEQGRVYRLVSMAWPNKKRAPDEYFVPLLHPVTGQPCPVPERGWRNPPETMQRLLAAGLVEFGPDHGTQPQRRYHLDENMFENVPSVLPHGGADDALLASLGVPFEHPKPVAFARDLLTWFCPPDGLVLDFFAGSGTTGHAVWLANQADGGARRFVLVQLPEPTGIAAFPTVADITRARLAAAARTLFGSTPALDLGFRAFRLDTTNLKPWEGSLGPDLLDLVDPVKPERSDDDVLFELMVKLGLDLAASVETRTVAGRPVRIVDRGALVACLARDVDLAVVEGIAALTGELPSLPGRVVFRDAGFADDVVKTNATQILRRAGIDDVKTL